MRADALGMFWEDHPAIKARGEKTFVPRTLPPIPDTGWVMPTEFPRLDAATEICIDCETYDPELLTHGHGWGRGVGHIVGIAVGVEGARWYFPMRHTLGNNLPPEAVLQWCRDTLQNARQPKVFANAQYDLGWLKQEGVDIAGQIIDVQIAEPLLDEHARSYSLDTLAKKYLGTGKVDDALYTWCQRAYGGKEGRPQAGNIYRAPSCLVGPYAEGDVTLPLEIWRKQKPLLEAEGLMPLFEIESALPQILMRMRMRGVRVDVAKAEQVKAQLRKKANALGARLKSLTGRDVEIWAADSISRALDKLGVEYPRTEKGAASFTGEWLKRHPHEAVRMIADIRRYDKAVSTFIDGYVLDKQVNGRVHGTFHQLRGDSGGTIVGRFSSSDPNLENIPARDDELAPLIRGLWLPEEGARWTVFDFSQIQFRIIVHYAMGAGAEEARRRYEDDPSTDYHAMVQELIRGTTGILLDRKPVKNINFGLAFTMGVDKLADILGMNRDEAQKLIDLYHQGVPFVRHTADSIAQVAQQRGYIKGILGRRHRFELWEPRNWKLRSAHSPTRDRHGLEQDCGPAVRAYCHLGLNRLAQDGEGSHVKKAIVDCDRAGIFDVTGPLLNIVHDDVNYSNDGSQKVEEALAEAKRIMENAIQWKVPMVVQRSDGDDWGRA
jgi:DNA polymerase I-like protein with 3'-5' exonuclease and polymerase domains